MLNKETERLIRVAHSCEYRAFGFGVDSRDFASRLLKLRDTDSAMSSVLFDISDRVLFVDHLRFETGWQTEDAHRSVGDTMRFSDNLDVLEIYLLCTCVDALASCLGKDPESGLTQTFVGFFQQLPEFLLDFIVDRVILVNGHHSRKALEKWKALDTREKVEKLAEDYWYKVRRSKYTHRSNIQNAASDGHLRRVAERGLIDIDGREGWRVTTLRSAKDPEKIRYTLFTHTSLEEAYLLRAVLAVAVLTDVLGYSLSPDYHQQFFEYYDAVSAVYAFLYEMQKNRAHLDLLTAYLAVVDDNLYQSSPIPGFSTAAGDRLLKEFPEYVESSGRDIRHYLNQFRELNEHIAQFNRDNDPATTKWLERRQALAMFCQELSLLHEVGTARSQHWWIYPILKRHIETGQMLRCSNKVLVSSEVAA